MRVLTASQIREADRRTIDEIGIPARVLMENAGRQVVAALESLHPDLHEHRVAVVCGKGNNGGDGFVVARRLSARGCPVRTVLLAPREEVQGDARVNLEILERMGGAPLSATSAELPAVREALASDRKSTRLNSSHRT